MMKSFPVKEGIPGFLFGGVAAGIKNSKKDLGIIISSEPASAAGVFTKNRVKAAPLLLCRKRLNKGFCRAVLVNSGNANACTGKKGMADADTTCSRVSSFLKINKNLVVPCSTGVIGVPLPVEKISRAIPGLIQKAGRGGIADFAESILTTDTYPKIAARRETVDGETVKVCGIAKGAGMIGPDMATMLVFIVSNAAVRAELLSQMLKHLVDETFNRITIDGDMSTNDTVLLLTNGRSKNMITSRTSKGYKSFENMLYEVMQQLAVMLVKDGEGATKMLAVKLINARTGNDAKKAALQVANSSLVKTAFFGEDFNWGRIMAALGSCGASFDPERVDIFFNDIPAVRNGQGVKENIAELKKTVKKKEIDVTIDLKKGNRSCEIKTCDLSYEYVRINAEYTT